MPAIIPLIAAGVSIYAAHKQSEAAKDVATTQATASEKGTAAQSDAAEKALQFQKEQYRNTQIATAPYQNMGAGALAALGSGLGVTPGNIAPTPIGLDRQAGTTTSGFLTPQELDTVKNATPTGFPNLTPNQQRIDAQDPASTANLSQSSVRMQSPDGSETQMVSRDKVPYYLQKGATVVQ